MNRKRTISTAVILVLILTTMSLIPATSAADPPPQGISARSLVAVYYSTQAELNAIGAEYAVWTVYPDQGYALVSLWPDEYETLYQAGYRLEVIQTLDATTEAALDPRFHYFDDHIPNSRGRYILDWLHTITAQHPALTELYDIGDAWLADNGGYPRDIWVLRISNEDHAYGPMGDKPVFFIHATIHATEVTLPELAMRYAEYLLNGYRGAGGYGIDADATWLVNHNVLYILVMQNPDGHAENEKDVTAYRRKNMDDDDGCSDPDRWGVDLNRNHSFMWNCCGGSSGNPCADTYRGSSPASEPEIQAFQGFFDSVVQDQNGPNGDNEIPPAAPDDTTGIVITLHSYSDLVLWPWAFDDYGPAPNDAQLAKIGRKFAYYNGYDAAGTIWYVVDGATDDWTYGKYGVASFCFEVGSDSGVCGGFVPPYECIDGYAGRDFWAENGPAFRYAHKIARTPYITAYGPDALNVYIPPATIMPGDPAPLSADIRDQRIAGDPLVAVTAAEYFIDAPGQDGNGTPMMPTDGDWGETHEGVEAVIDTTGLALGNHYVLVHGRNDDGQWGPFTAAWLTVGPVVTVGDIQMGYRRIGGDAYRLGALVPVRDGDGQPLPGATVEVQVRLPAGIKITRSAETEADGAARFVGTTRQQGTYVLTIVDVQADGYTYQPAWNDETSERLQVP